mgnify:CR=1 FL=1
MMYITIRVQVLRDKTIVKADGYIEVHTCTSKPSASYISTWSIPDKHYHMFQQLVHKNNAAYIDQQKVDHTMSVDTLQMD